MRGVIAGAVAAAASALLAAPAIAPVPNPMPMRWDEDPAFVAERPAEVIAWITAICSECAWETPGREAAALTISLDGRYSQTLLLVRRGRAEYKVLLGPVDPGPHRVRIVHDPKLTPLPLATRVAVQEVRFQQVVEGSPDFTALSLAPFLHARPNTLGRFTDVPVFGWYETEPTTRGTRYRYSYVFTHEDGGTPTDRLMATWGRSTDIEYLYSVEIGRDGAIVAEDFQGPDHEILPYAGPRIGRHPQLWVVTDNNMVLDRGTPTVRHAPAPIHFPLHGISREAVMDAHPWLYEVASRELLREGRIAADAPPGRGIIPDPRRFVYVEACGEAGVTALSFAVRAGDSWYSSDRGVPEYRIVRAGCFRGAVPLPTGVDLNAIDALRFQAHARPNPPGAGQPVTTRPDALLTRINRVFTLDAQFRPTASRFSWVGRVTLTPGESWEFALP